MKREWKPGDVAMWTKHNTPVMYVERERANWPWVDRFDNHSRIPEDELRPLVVIDPESIEDVKRLCNAYRSVDHSIGQRPMQAALREFADPKPPKPVEPTGLGAVVEDKRGFKFVRVAESFDGWAKDRDWQRIGGEINSVRNFGWKDVDAVIVLSEGVQS